ncbi:MAG: hypothetical protein RQ760_21890 [Sedimentisphaerales bacterium]|nr:hypothetical protein [Sedimentisphaerales bacterium]
MRISGIIHQQICQLKWHLLACLGLIMVLPVEEVIVNLRAGDHNFTTGMTSLAIMFGPFLAGLIACANIQGDLDEKRYIFWRSKPANVKLLIIIKFFTGLIASLLIIACPVVFTILCKIIWDSEGIDIFIPLPILISILTYSLCFACNVLVRKTARAWLIGMLMTGFLLVLPFMLPLDFKDYMNDIMFLMFGFFMTIILAASVAAFIFALFAAMYDWHLRTNLKVLLWVGAGLVFTLMMLFSSQVANIKVLQEKEIDISYRWNSLDYAGSRVVFQGYIYVDTDKGRISLNNISGGPNFGLASRPPRMEGYRVRRYPRRPRYPSRGRIYKNIGNDIYSFVIDAYFHQEQEGHSTSQKRTYEKIYLRSYKHTEKYWTLVCELDISDCLTDRIDTPRATMRLIDNRLIACVHNSCVVVDVTEPGELKIIDKYLDKLKKYGPYGSKPPKNRKKEFAIPLVPVEEIELQEKIKLSIDLNYQFHYGGNNIYKYSIVDVHDGKFAFFFIDYDDIARFDVIRWDDEKVYCKYGSSRPFTILESVTGADRFYDDNFVKNGKFYCRNNHTLLVFDVRANSRIRKLGHFVRMSYGISDMAVLDDDNIVLCMRQDYDLVEKHSKKPKTYLYLLKNPE